MLAIARNNFPTSTLDQAGESPHPTAVGSRVPSSLLCGTSAQWEHASLRPARVDRGNGHPESYFREPDERSWTLRLAWPAQTLIAESERTLNRNHPLFRGRL
jgi:hypothetical protein